MKTLILIFGIIIMTLLIVNLIFPKLTKTKEECSFLTAKYSICQIVKLPATAYSSIPLTNCVPVCK